MLLIAPEGRHTGSPGLKPRVFKMQIFFAPRWFYAKRDYQYSAQCGGLTPERHYSIAPINIICRSEIVRGAK